MAESHQEARVQEQRSQIRFVTRLDARAFPGALPCLVADISNRGARLQFREPPALEDEFVLVEWNGGRAYECQLAWRKGLEIGVRFLSTCNLQGPTRPLFAEARRAWQDAVDRPVTTFAVRQHDRRWVVTISSPTLGDPAEVGSFLTRWEAQQFARLQAQTFRGRAFAAERPTTASRPD